MKCKIIVITISIFFNLLHLSAQYASIQGIITGEDDREGLVGVNILLKGSVHGTVSGIHGDYILRDIQAGKQTIIFSYLGY